MRKQLLSILCALLMVLSLLPSSAFASDNFAPTDGKTLNLSASLLTKTIPQQSDKNPLYRDTLNTASEDIQIYVSLSLISAKRCVCEGSLIFENDIHTFTTEGTYYFGNNATKAILVEMSGEIKNSPMTLIVSHDYEMPQTYIYCSLGALSKNSAPIQLEFGGFSNEIYRVNEEYIKSAGLTEVSPNQDIAISPESADKSNYTKSSSSNVGVARHQGNKSFVLPNNSVGGYISLFCPDTIRTGMNFKAFAKLTTRNTELLSYIKQNVEARATGPIRVYSADIQMRADHPEITVIKSYPKSSKDKVTTYIPYYNASVSLSPFSVSVKKVTLTASYVTRTHINEGTYDVGTNHKFYFGTLGSVANTNCIDSPQYSQAGIGVYNLFSFQDNYQHLKLTASANLVAGYVGAGPRSGSRIVKSVNIGSTSISKTMRVLPA